MGLPDAVIGEPFLFDAEFSICYDGGMEIAWSEHARKQLTERNLLPADIERTVRTPDKLAAQSAIRYQAVRTLRKGNRQYLLVVIYDQRNGRREIVTAFLTSKMKKYL